MPTIIKTLAMATGTTGNPLSGSQYEFLPFNAYLEFAVVSDVASVQATVYSGSDVLQEQGDVPIKAANTSPIYPDDFLLSDVAAAGERISVQLRNNNAGAANVRTVVRITPAA
jgi:hypothetical protein